MARKLNEITPISFGSHLKIMLKANKYKIHFKKPIKLEILGS